MSSRYNLSPTVNMYRRQRYMRSGSASQKKTTDLSLLDLTKYCFKNKISRIWLLSHTVIKLTLMVMIIAACLKRGPVSVEEELLSLAVPVHTAFSRIAEQRVGKSRQRSQLGLVSLSADVDDHPLTPGCRAVVIGRQDLTVVVLRSHLLRLYTQRITVPTQT